MASRGRDKQAAAAALTEYRQKRDFTRTAEPAGGHAVTAGPLRFVVQKHAARQLHFDLRLELDGVMKSWAVPKGPSLDPTVKRLAMEVEDHPIEYNAFEGTIPQGEYGGGTVMVWDQGTYAAEGATAAGSRDDTAAIRAGYERGDLKIVMYGERMRGSWVLVRTRFGPGSSRGKPSWLLIKHRDDYAKPGSDLVATSMTSVGTGRTMEEIAAAGSDGPVWTSDRSAPKPPKPPKPSKPTGKGRRAGAAKVDVRAPARPARSGAGKNSSARTSRSKSATSATSAMSARARGGAAARSTPTGKQVSARPAGGRAVRKAAYPGRVARAPDRSPESQGNAGVPRLPFPLTHLDKVFFPKDGYTKGDLIRYYARVAPQILPAIADRPLSLKRYPNGVGGPFFFQQNAPAGDAAPPGVRIESVMVELDGAPHPRFVGGALATLLYTVQLGCIGVDPWHARVRSLTAPDYLVIDLDPGDKVPFPRVVEVAQLVHAVLDAMGLRGVPKTSGSRGIHIYVPLAPRTAGPAAAALARVVASRVVKESPKRATLQRDMALRPRDAVYVDHLQNARGKTVAAAYAVRAVDGARVSMPLRWDELSPDLDARDFTIETAPVRIAAVGDLWAEGMARRNPAAAVRRAIESE